MSKPRSIGAATAAALALAFGMGGCAADVTEVSFVLQSTGGFAGHGALQCTLAGGLMTAADRSTMPGACSGEVSAEQVHAVLAAAQRVDWDAVARSYRPPANPDCADDGLIFDLFVWLTRGDGSTELVQTTWCDVAEGTLPGDLTAFLATTDDLCRVVLDWCAG